MKRVASVPLGLLVAVALALPNAALSQTRSLNTPPAGFTALFDGADLTGWRGLKGDYSPHVQAALAPADLAAMQTQWNTDRDLHWSVDKAKGEIVSDEYHGVFLATAKDYGDFEMYVDWLMVNHNGDSQVSICAAILRCRSDGQSKEVGNGALRGSGASVERQLDNPGRFGRWSRPIIRSESGIPFTSK